VTIPLNLAAPFGPELESKLTNRKDLTMLLKKWHFLGWLIPQVLSLTWPLIFWTFQYHLLGAFWFNAFCCHF
jgi:hypothetical protein